MESVLQEKSKKFALDIIDLSKNVKNKILCDQVFRSGTSIGANIMEANYAVSKSDFINKLHIALKECNETLYWLYLIKEGNFIDIDKQIWTDCNELKRMLVKALTTSKNSV